MPDRVDNPAPGTEVGQVADAFNHMLEHVEAALRERHASEDRLRRFIADASHELRTPVAVIRSHAEYAQRLDESLPPDVDRALDRITSESNRMSVLVDDLLLLARLDAGRPLASDTVDLTRLTLDAVRDAQVAGRDHTWRLELPDEPVQVTGDEHALHSALANLLTNARVHTPAGSTVTVSLVRAAPGRVRLSVADDGPGVPTALSERVFERLVHGESSSRQTGGSGLGLAIVAAIVAAHGGRVDLQSRPGHTVFTVDLPAPDAVASTDLATVEVLGDH
jgi:two-component system OmpR family sensor kinase